MRKKSLLSISIIIAMLLTCFLAACKPTKGYLSDVADEAKEIYLADYYDAFMEDVRELTGLSDLVADLRVLDKNNPGYYHESDHSVSVSLNWCDFRSDVIDEYYTQEMDDNGVELKNRMHNLLRELEEKQSFTFRTEQGMEVFVTVSYSSAQLSVYTSAEREYYYYTHDGMQVVDVDNQMVFYKKGSSSDSASSGSGSSSSGNSTSGGSSSGSSSSGSGSSSKSDNRSGSSGSGSKKTYPHNDPYDVDNYNDPDDFANEYEDEFDDYDDAYDYWEEEHY